MWGNSKKFFTYFYSIKRKIMYNSNMNYTKFRNTIFDKDKATDIFFSDFIERLLTMFQWYNVPKEIPIEKIDEYLLNNGNCIFTKLENTFYIFNGVLSGQLDEYNRPIKYNVSNSYLNLSKEFTIDNDCILLKNTATNKTIFDILSKECSLIIESDITIATITKILRSQYFISGGDNRTIQSAKEFLQKLDKGELGVIAENGFLEGLKIQNLSTAGGFVQQFIELRQYLQASANNRIGLNDNVNLKRERLTINEVRQGNNPYISLVYNMLNERQKACKRINEMYNLNMKVDLANEWKREKEILDNEVKLTNTNTLQEKENGIETKIENEGKENENQ